MGHKEIKFNGRVLRPRKATASPNFGAETVLVADPWDYVGLWLKRNRHDSARNYWLQAQEFSKAASVLPPTSAPLPAYYCFLNATKCLLEVRGVKVSDRHGVGGGSSESGTSLDLERVKFHAGGILPGLCGLLEESTQIAEYSLKQALYNLPYIHRAYALTFTSSQELFIPIRNLRFVKKLNSRESWFCADVEARYNNMHTSNKLAPRWEFIKGEGDVAGVIRMRSRFDWEGGKPKSEENMERLRRYHRRVRKQVSYIYGPNRLWYIKRGSVGPNYLSRSSLTLTFAAMHRLSELSRYHPLELRAHLDRQHNWLLSEFIKIAPTQFVDEIASEITGCDFLPPGIRM